MPLQPSINYTAPELIRSKTASIGSAADVFSLGCLAYHLIARKPLFDCHNNAKMVLCSFSLSFCILFYGMILLQYGIWRWMHFVSCPTKLVLNIVSNMI